MSQDLNSKKIAMRYGTALYQAMVSEQPKMLEPLYLFSQQMHHALSMKETVMSLENIVHKNPISLIDLIKECAKAAKLKSVLFDNFLDMLITRRRVNILPNIFEAFTAHYRHENKIDTAMVTSAFTLDAKLKTKIKTHLEKQMNKVIEFDFAEDTSILAGLKIQIGSQMIDMTLSNQIKTLEQAMKEVSNG